MKGKDKVKDKDTHKDKEKDKDRACRKYERRKLWWRKEVKQ